MDQLVFKQIRCRAHLKCTLDYTGNVLCAAISIPRFPPPVNGLSLRRSIVAQAGEKINCVFAKVNSYFHKMLHSMSCLSRPKQCFQSQALYDIFCIQSFTNALTYFRSKSEFIKWAEIHFHMEQEL